MDVKYNYRTLHRKAHFLALAKGYAFVCGIFVFSVGNEKACITDECLFSYCQTIINIIKRCHQVV